jgi:hypothetical protein
MSLLEEEFGKLNVDDVEEFGPSGCVFEAFPRNIC